MNRLEILDFTRFFAAIVVVLYHYTFNGINNTKINSITYIESVVSFTKYGYLGVELFFMISGYVIFQSALNRTAAEFTVSRALRLYPAYWFAVIFTSIFALSWGGQLMQVNPLQIAVNFTMLQSFFYIPHVDGAYWTLVYEIKFYFAVIVLLLFKLQKYLRKIFTFWPTILLIALILGLEKNVYLGGYYNFFSAGALLAVFSLQKTLPTFINLVIVYFLCVNFSVNHASFLNEAKGIDYSVIVITCIITSFFVLFIFQNTKRAEKIKIPGSKLLGNLTYPTYLIHAHFGYILFSNFANEQNKILAYISITILVLGIAYLINEFVEKRLQPFWKIIFTLSVGKFVGKIQNFINYIFELINSKLKKSS